MIFNRNKAKRGQNVLFIETRGCMAEQHYLAGVGEVVERRRLRQNRRYVEVVVKLTDNAGYDTFVEGAVGVVKLNENTWMIYK